MKRELPRIIRRALEAKIEKFIGPLQETLKNDLENIVRDCQENLTRSYMNTVQSPDTLPRDMNQSIEQQQQTPQASLAEFQPSDPAVPSHFATEQLAQYFVPPDAAFDPWPGMAQSSSNACTQDSFSDSANYSLSTNAQNHPWDDVWLNNMSSNNMGDILSASEPRNVQTNTMNYENEVMFQPLERYAGKGKGRAMDPGLDSDIDMDPT
jgi:hypothetical protein